jgi:hypothetical protein
LKVWAIKRAEAVSEAPADASLLGGAHSSRNA